MNGYIKLFRQLIEWEWYNDTNVKLTFIHLLLTVNFKDKKWKGIIIKRGQLLTSPARLGEAVGLSVQQIRTVFKKLKSTGEITIKTTNKFTLVTLVNFDAYQVEELKSNNQITNGQQSNNNQVTTTEEGKESKEEKEDLFDLRDNKNLPFDLVTATHSLNALFSDKSKAVDLVKQVFGQEVNEQDVSIAIQSFCSVAITNYDTYRGIRTIEKLKNKFIDWIPKSVKYQATQNPPSQKTENLDLEKYILQYYPKELKHWKKNGEFERLEKLLANDKFKLTNISKNKKNASYTALFLFECCHMRLGNRLNGSTPQRKLESLDRWEKTLNDYNRNKGDLRSLLKQKV